jgi:RNA polymerase sigma-70 factor (ECF subfamily)
MSSQGTEHSRGDAQDRAQGSDGNPSSFPATRWSLVGRAAGAAKPPVSGHSGHSGRREALGVLLQRYLPALRAHLLARRRISADRIDDLLQGFVAEKVLERDLLAAADQARGRFRAFLVTALENYAANQVRHESAGCRNPAGSGAGKLLTLDVDGAPDPAARAVPHDGFDVAWAREVLREAVVRTREECLATGRADLWDVLSSRVVAPALGDSQRTGYTELVARHGYATPKHAQNALTTAKRRFEQVLRGVIAEYVLDDEELEAELDGLGEILRTAAQLETPGRPRGTRADGDGDGDGDTDADANRDGNGEALGVEPL